jgi:hypothetical protein
MACAVEMMAALSVFSPVAALPGLTSKEPLSTGLVNSKREKVGKYGRMKGLRRNS